MATDSVSVALATDIPFDLTEVTMSNFWSKYGKALAAILFAAITAVQAAVSDGHITPAEGIQIVLAAITAVGVWLVPAVPDWPWMKTAVAVLLAAGNVLVTAVARGIVPADWAELVLAALTVLGVGVTPANSRQVLVAAKRAES